MVVNTVLSVLGYDYPPENLTVYLSDDGGSEVMFYALLEASDFAKHWLPFCKKFKVKTTSQKAYFLKIQGPDELVDALHFSHDWLFIKDKLFKLMDMQKLHNQMRDRIETATSLGRVSDETRLLHKGFHEWNSNTTSSDHQAIVQIRESSVISNGSIILTVDCDVYSDNSESVRDDMCCFMDEENGNKIGYVQFPQSSYNITTHDMYASCFRVPNEVCKLKLLRLLHEHVRMIIVLILLFNSWKWEAWMLMEDLAILAVDAFTDEARFVGQDTLSPLKQNGIQKILQTKKKARV
ncbi:hypothetical protein L1987_58445 [Smallanthus sonchifolius]|uniref:Uncharacterized protein n=1 Tax=Smallanthus sonchifolius TaxID=185202 RepID=A0ACB9DFB3_9ASTR|nr:hypothetical protein L1987_58445 [Smallanthus sonchifolius]